MSAPYATENRLVVGINKDTTANVAIIAAPGAGKRIAIDYLFLNVSGGANTVTVTGSVAIPITLADQAQVKLENSIHNPTGIFPCNDNQAFSLALGSATAVEGYTIYRIIGQ